MRLIRLKKDPGEDDMTLIHQYRETGEKEIIGILFERYAHLVLGVCMRYLKNEQDSKDAVLHIFEKLMLDLKKYEISRFSPWLHSVARNYCFMQLRNKEALSGRSEEITDYRLFVESGQGLHQEDNDLQAYYLNNLEQAIAHLNTEQKICIELFYLREESYQDIAGLTGFSLNQVKSHIQNGKRNLKIFLQKKNHENAS